MITKILFIFLLILVITLSGLVYLNEFLLPVKFKELLIQKISQEFQRNIAIENLTYTLLQGLVIHNIIISEKQPHRDVFLAIEKISLGALPFFPLAKQKIVVPSVMIQNPTLHISRDRLGQWNIKDLLTPKDTTKKEFPWDIYFANVSATGASILFSDKKIAKKPIAIIDNISLTSSLALPRKAQVTLHVKPSSQNPLKIFLNFNIDLFSGNFISQGNIENLYFMMFESYLPKENFSFQNGKIDISSFEIQKKGLKMTAKGSIALDNVKLDVNDAVKLSCSPLISVENLVFENNWLKLAGIIQSPNTALESPYNLELKTDLFYDFALFQDDQTIKSEGHLKLANAMITKEKEEEKHLKTNAQGQISFSFYKDNIFHFLGDFHLQDTNLKLNENKILDPSSHLSLLYTYNPDLKKNPISYTATATLTSATLTGIPWVERIEQISGNLSFKPDEISSTGLQGIAQQIPLMLSGRLNNFEKPLINIQGELSPLDLKAITDILSSLNPESPIHLQGLADVSFEYQGGLESLEGSGVNLSANIQEATLQSSYLPGDFTNISGRIEYDNPRISTRHFLPNQSGWENLKFTFGGRDYISQGSLNFNNWSLHILSENIKLTTRGSLSFNKINITSLNGSYFDSSVALKGAIFYGQKHENPFINVSGSGEVQLDHLSDIFPILYENNHWQQWQPRGKIAFRSRLSGNFDNWRDWALSASADSQEIFLKNYKIENILFQYDQRNRAITTCNLKTQFYDGPLTLEASVNLAKDDLPYHVEINLVNADLFQFRQDAPFKDKPLGGFISLSYAGQGELFDLSQTSGQGSLTAQEGQLMHIDLLKGLGQLLFIPEYRNITFQSAYADFILQDETVLIHDGVLRSNQMRLTCNGTIDFQGNLNLDIISRFDRSTLQQSKSLRKTIASILTQTDDFLTIKLTGTLQNPSYYIVPEPSRFLERTRDFILEGLPSIFEEIF